MRYAGHIRFLWPAIGSVVLLLSTWLLNEFPTVHTVEAGNGWEGNVRLAIVISSGLGHSWLPFGQQIICILQVRPKKSERFVELVRKSLII